MYIGVRGFPYGICCPWVRVGWYLDALGTLFRLRRPLLKICFAYAGVFRLCCFWFLPMLKCFAYAGVFVRLCWSFPPMLEMFAYAGVFCLCWSFSPMLELFRLCWSCSPMLELFHLRWSFSKNKWHRFISRLCHEWGPYKRWGAARHVIWSGISIRIYLVVLHI